MLQNLPLILRHQCVDLSQKRSNSNINSPILQSKLDLGEMLVCPGMMMVTTGLASHFSSRLAAFG